MPLNVSSSLRMFLSLLLPSAFGLLGCSTHGGLAPALAIRRYGLWGLGWLAQAKLPISSAGPAPDSRRWHIPVLAYCALVGRLGLPPSLQSERRRRQDFRVSVRLGFRHRLPDLAELCMHSPGANRFKQAEGTQQCKLTPRNERPLLVKSGHWRRAGAVLDANVRMRPKRTLGWGQVKLLL